MIHNLRVRSLELDFLEISWEVTATGNPLDLYFTVERSESPGGPYTPISPALQDRYVFVDGNLPQGNLWRVLYYRVRVRQVGRSGEYVSPEVQQEPEPDLIALEIRRHHQLLFREFAGRKCYLLPTRTFGPRCTCWNETLQQRTRSRCLTCYDTSFVGGYMAPMEMWISIDPAASAEANTNVGTAQSLNTTARTGYYPALKPRDVIVELENKRWRVANVSTPEHARSPVYQEVSLHLIPLGDIEYRYKVLPQSALRYMWGAPERNFTNPANLETAGTPRPPD